MNGHQKINLETSKRRNSAILIANIFAVQLTTSAIIYNLNLVTHFPLTWIVIYYVLTLFAAIPQSGFSDFYGRKKHLLISSICVLLSAVYLSLAHIVKIPTSALNSFSISIITTFPVCFLLGVTGNAIPIARAGIADLKIHDFRTAMGWSTTFIGFGWITSIMLGLVLPPIGVLMVVILVQAIVTFIIKYVFDDTEDLSITNPRPHYLNTIFKSYQWFGSMFLVTGGAAAILAYLFTETSFYQIYSINEEGVISLGSKVTGLVMAFGYAFGVIIQWIINWSDKSGIKFGITFSLLSLAFLVVFKLFFQSNLPIFNQNHFIIEGILNFLFSLGFGFSVPSLFSLMSSKIEPHHSGRLFGAIDTTDTLALSLSSFALYLRDKLKFKDTIVYSLLLLFFISSFIFYRVFIKRFSSYEKKLK